VKTKEGGLIEKAVRNQDKELKALVAGRAP
jgi:hypothetical protein